MAATLADVSWEEARGAFDEWVRKWEWTHATVNGTAVGARWRHHEKSLAVPIALNPAENIVVEVFGGTFSPSECEEFVDILGHRWTRLYFRGLDVPHPPVT